MSPGWEAPWARGVLGLTASLGGTGSEAVGGRQDAGLIVRVDTAHLIEAREAGAEYPPDMTDGPG